MDTLNKIVALLDTTIEGKRRAAAEMSKGENYADRVVARFIESSADELSRIRADIQNAIDELKKDAQ